MILHPSHPTRTTLTHWLFASKLQHVVIPLVVIVGSWLSIFYFFYLDQERQNDTNQLYLHIMREMDDLLHNQVDQFNTLLQSVSGLYDASEHVTLQEFHQFVTPLLTHHGPPLTFIAWVPDHHPSTSDTHSSHFFPAYVQPEGSLGTLKEKDWNRDPVLRRSMTQAAREHRMAVTQCISGLDVVGTDEGCHAIFLFPVYDHPAVGNDSATPPLSGFIALGLKLEHWFSRLVPRDHAQQMSWLLTDITDPEAIHPLLSHDADADEKTIMAQSVRKNIHSLPKYIHQTDIPIGGNLWRLTSLPKPVFFARPPLLHWFFLISGILITAMISMYLYGIKEFIKQITREKAFSDMLFATELNGKLTFNHDLRITSINRQLTPFMANRERKLIGCRLDEVEELSHIQGFMTSCQETMRHGLEGFLSQINWGMATGKNTLYFDIAISPIDDGMGRRVGGLVTLHNVSEHVILNRQLRLERDMTRRYLDMADAIIIVLDLQGHIHFINQKGLRILGYTNQELIGKNLAQHLIPEHWRPEMVKTQERVLNGNSQKNLPVHTQICTLTGLMRTIAWRVGPMTDDRGEINGMLCVGEDVTFQVRTEQRLRRSEARFRMMASTAQDAIIEVNKENVVLFWNNAAEQMFQYSAKEAIGKNLHQLVVPGPMLAQANHSFAHFFGRNRKIEPGKVYTLNAKRQDSHEFPVELSLSLIDQGEDDQRVVGIVRDVTERKRLEEQERFASFQAGVAEMSVSVIHNIGNAIMSLLGRTEDISRISEELERLATLFAQVKPMAQGQADQGIDPRMVLNQVMMVIDEVSDELKHLASGRLVIHVTSLREAAQHVRDIIRIQQESSHYTLRERFIFKDLIDDCRVMLLDPLTQSDIQFSINQGPTVREVTLPRGQTLQMMINLVKNGCEAINDPNHVRREPGRIEVSWHQDGEEWLEISVTDNGIGLNEAQRSTLFSYGVSSKSRGSGFGLHSCANFVQHLGGTITCHSDGPGQGARFVVRLPLAKALTDVEKR
ncbi:MAG: PAS domain S-box protein [Magnetococcus sp. THC-1_WYH]